MGLLKKITGGAKKLVRKVVPKELAGIMQVAAPFVAPTSLPGALALSLGGQLRSGQGKINPFSTLAAIAPSEQFRNLYQGYDVDLPFGKSFSLGDNKLTDLGMDLDDFLYGYKSSSTGDMQGILGTGGKFGPKKILQGTLLSPEGTLSKTRVAALAASGLSLAQAQAQITEEAEEVGVGDSELAALQQEAAEMWKDFDTTQFRPKITAAIGGLMRKNLREGSGDELPPDPTTPVNPFKPKPIGPVLPNKAEASPMELLNSMAIELFGKPLDQLDDRQRDMIMSFMKPQAKQGGLMRSNFALGTKPTSEESGLGGLPIEADMRYSGGFMPYGEKEKADDVPARLSKNEFVFTADAVRAAGGGSIQKGAQKMYNSMKQLESMGRSVA